MNKIFTNNAEPLSSKDYIERKRNIRIYEDFSKNTSPEKKIAHKKNNKLTNTNNHSNLLKLTKGYYNYNQDKCKNDSFFTTYQGETILYDLHDRRLCGEEVPVMNYVEHIGDFNEIAQIRDDYEPNFNFERDYSKVGTIPAEANKQLFDEKIKIHEVKCFQYPLPDLPSHS